MSLVKRLLCVFLALSQLHADNVFNYLSKVNQFENPGIKGIDAVVCINLKVRPEKWITVREKFKNFNINLQRFDAVNGWESSHIDEVRKCFCYTNNQTNDNQVKDLTNGELGVYLSHLSLWEQGLKHNLNTLWIVEDDADIKSDPNVMSKLVQHLESIDPKWDCLYTDAHFWNNLAILPFQKRKRFIVNMAHYMKRCRPRLITRNFPEIKNPNYYGRESVVSPYLKRVYARWGLHSVIFSKRGLKKLVDYFHKVKVILPADGEIFLVPDLRMYTVRRDVVGQNFRTTISDTRFKPNEQ